MAHGERLLVREGPSLHGEARANLTGAGPGRGAPTRTPADWAMNHLAYPNRVRRAQVQHGAGSNLE